MRACLIVVALLVPSLAAAADLDRPAGRHRVRAYARVGVSAGYRLAPPPGPIVVAPPATYLVVPPPAPLPGLAYTPPPVPTEPPSLITALPIIGPYLVFSDGPPPATVLDGYDHRSDYNQ